MFKNKVVFGGEVLIDLTEDNVTQEDVTQGVKFHLPSGEPVEGTSTKDSDTKDATAVEYDILDGKTAYARENKLVGTMPNRGSVKLGISEKDQQIEIEDGFHDGTGRVYIDPAERAKIDPDNIRHDVKILGVEGTYHGEDTPTQTKTAIPYITSQEVTNDPGFNMTKVIIEPIYYDEVDNAFGGKTAKIGTVAPS